MENKTVAIVIYEDGTVEIVNQIAVGAAQVAIQRLQQALAQVRVGPEPMPAAMVEDNGSSDSVSE